MLRAPSSTFSWLARWQRLRLATRLSLAVTLASCVLFGLYGIRILRTEEQDLLRGSERDARLLARALQVAATQALRGGNLGDARELLVRLQTIEPQLRVLMVDSAGRTLLRTPEVPNADEVAWMMREVELRWQQRRPPPDDRVLRYLPPDDADRLQIALPLTNAAGQLGGQLVIQQSLRELRDDLRQTRTALLWTVALFAAVAWLIAYVVGDLSIGRPLRALIAAMRAVRRGDLTSAAEPLGGREVVTVTREFNAMMGDLREARAELESVAEARRQEQRALQQADKLVTLGQLSAGLAHEIGSPLQVLGGRARTLLLRRDDPAEVERIARIIADQTERIRRIVEQLLQYTRRRPARIADHDLPAVCRQVVDLLEGEARRTGVALTSTATEALPLVRCDADQIQQLVLNLLTNALYATPPGGSISLVLSLVRDVTPPAVRCVVRDTGCGMTDEVRERLFEPFFTTRAAQGGTGLGLAVVRAIVNDHRGSIAVQSLAGSGTTVCVTLPVDGETSSVSTYGAS